MTPDFSITDPATWPVALTLEQVAAISQKTTSAVRHACKPTAKRPFLPQPYEKRPLRWRRVDVVRFLRLGATS